MNEEILKIIKGLRKKRLNMFGGNCGMFALALGRYIKEKYNITPCYLLATSIDIDEKPEDVDDYEELEFGDYDLCHVMVGYQQGGNYCWFDGDGMFTNDVETYLLNFCKEFYDNPYPSFFTLSENDAKASKIKTIISQNTNWRKDDDDFYKAIVEISKQ